MFLFQSKWFSLSWLEQIPMKLIQFVKPAKVWMDFNSQKFSCTRMKIRSLPIFIIVFTLVFIGYSAPHALAFDIVTFDKQYYYVRGYSWLR